MTLEKIALGYHDLNNNDVADLGDTIDYSFIVTNTGTSRCTISVSPIRTGGVNPSGSLILSLAVGASDSGVTATHTIDSVDVGRGYFDNMAVAAGDEISVPSGTVDTLLASVGELMRGGKRVGKWRDLSANTAALGPPFCNPGRRCRVSAPGAAASSSRRGRPAACG